MDISNLIASGLISTLFSHPYGHLAKGAKYDAPLTVDYRRGIERFTDKQAEKKLTRSEMTDIFGGGFQGQDTIAAAINTPESSLVNALHKGAYVVADSIYGVGDISSIAKNSGLSRDQVKGMLAFTVADDIRRAFGIGNPNLNLGGTVIDGAPGLIGTYRW